MHGVCSGSTCTVVEVIELEEGICMFENEHMTQMYSICGQHCFVICVLSVAQRNKAEPDTV